MHAHIRWSGGRWELHDHSSNGTLVSGKLVRHGERVVLRQGDLIHFSKRSAAHWRVGELSDPADTLWPLSGTAHPIPLDTVQVLPGSATSPVTVRRSADGGWLCDGMSGTRRLRDGDEVVSGQLAWRLVLAQGPESTLAMEEASDLSERLQQIDFTVSRDEEHVRAVLHTRGAALDLGERAHHYCLVTLARRRCADALAGYDTASQGWVDLETLARMLGTDVSHLNVQIHRARAQIGALLSPGSAPLIERRRGGVRLGETAFRVFRGAELECQSIPAGEAGRALSGPRAAAAPSSAHAGRA